MANSLRKRTLLSWEPLLKTEDPEFLALAEDIAKDLEATGLIRVDLVLGGCIIKAPLQKEGRTQLLPVFRHVIIGDYKVMYWDSRFVTLTK